MYTRYAIYFYLYRQHFKLLTLHRLLNSFLARKKTIAIYQIIRSLAIKAEKEYIKLQRESYVSNPQI